MLCVPLSSLGTARGTEDGWRATSPSARIFASAYVCAVPGRVEGANAWLNKRVAADGDDAQKNIERGRVWQKHQQNHVTVSPWMFAIAWLGLSFCF